MRIERAARKADIRRAVLAEAAHQSAPAAQHADGQPAGHRLAVGDHVGAHAEILLRAAGREPEADEHLVEDQHDAALRCTRRAASAATACRRRGRNAPCGRCRAASNRPGALAFGCSACSGLTSTQAMSRRLSQHAQRRLVHVLAACRSRAPATRIADARLHIAPPAVVGAAEAHQVAAPRVIARQAHRLHHGLGARHVKGNLIHAGDLEQPAHVVGDHRMVGAEHRAQIAHALAAAGDALLVEIVAEHVDAVGAGEVVELGCRPDRST